MKKVILLVLISLFLALPVFADREVPTIKGFTSSQLIQLGDAKVYRVEFIASSNNGSFSLHDIAAATSLSFADGSTTIKAEGQEATSGNSKYIDYSTKPLEFSNGLYLRVLNGTAVISYD